MMSTATINAGLIGWASGGVTSAPTAGRVTEGWLDDTMVGGPSPLEAPNRNYSWETVGQIVSFLQGSSWDIDLIVGRAVPANYIDLNASGGIVVANASIGLAIAGDTFAIGPSPGSYGYVVDVSSGTYTETGFAICPTVGAAAEGFRLAYAGGLPLDRNLATCAAAWGAVSTSFAAPVTGVTVHKDKSNGALFMIAGAAGGTIEVEADLASDAYDNAEARGASAVVDTLTEWKVDLNATGVTDIKVQVIQTDAAGVETAIATLGPQAAAVWAPFSAVLVSIPLDFSANSYTVRVIATGSVANASSGLWRNLRPKFSKGAAN